MIWETIKEKLAIIMGATALVLAFIALIIACVGVHKTNDLKWFYKPDHTGVIGNSTIWASKTSDVHKISLYFAIKKIYSDDFEWNGIYPDGYFNI